MTLRSLRSNKVNELQPMSFGIAVGFSQRIMGATDTALAEIGDMPKCFAVLFRWLGILEGYQFRLKPLRI